MGHCGTYIIYHHLLGPCTPTLPSGSKYLSKACKNIVPDRCCVPFFFLSHSHSFLFAASSFYFKSQLWRWMCWHVAQDKLPLPQHPLKSSPICYLAEVCDMYIFFFLQGTNIVLTVSGKQHNGIRGKNTYIMCNTKPELIKIFFKKVSISLLRFYSCCVNGVDYFLHKKQRNLKVPFINVF